MNSLERLPSKFLKNSRMKIITNSRDADMVLRHKSFEIPNLYQYLENLEKASGESFKMTRCFVNAAPFFLENERHQLIRKLALAFLHNKNLVKWDAFISHQIHNLISVIPKGQGIDLVQVVGYPLFDRIARPLLGVYPKDCELFDSKATVLQRLVEPMQSIRKLNMFEADFDLLVNMLIEVSNDKKPEKIDGFELPDCSLLTQLLNSKPLDEISCYAFSIAMYAALAPLVQTTVNMLAIILMEHQGQPLSEQDFKDNFDRLVHLATAPKYIHRIAKENIHIGDCDVEQGTTILIDIQQAFDVDVRCLEKLSKHFSFGAGAHFCVGAQLSKRILKELIPCFLQKFSSIEVVEHEIDAQNSIAYAYKKFIVNLY
jgi:cytochrome P450